MSEKTCRACQVTKNISEFHRAPRNTDGHNSLCKSCLLNRVAPIQTGTLRCDTCTVDLPCELFTVQRTNKNGRMSNCKKCVSIKNAKKRRENGPVYKTSKRTELGNYISLSCEVCGARYEPCRKRQRGCENCCELARKLNSSLTASRGKNPRKKVAYSTVWVIVKKYHRAKTCAYCGIELVIKSMDHKIPLCRGGDPNDSTNIEICCMDCNRAKAWLSPEDWLKLCRRVVAHMEKQS